MLAFNGGATPKTSVTIPENASQKEILQNLSFSSIDWWLEIFQENEVVTIQNLEDIRMQHPTSYAILKPQNINSLIAGPISMEGKVVGFLGVDNPNQETMSLIGPLLKVLGYFIVALLRRRDLLNHLHTLSFHDPLTGAYNRNAMFEHSKKFQNLDCVGMVYCDITGLKHTNDTLGHNAGDQLIQYCFDALRLTLDTPWLYRIGGDEFCVYLSGVRSREILAQKAEEMLKLFRRLMEQEEMEQEDSKILKLTEFVTANELASMMDIPVTQVIATCMSIGIMVSINQRLDAETINLVAEEFGYKTEYVSAEVAQAITEEEDNEEDLQPRARL